VVSNQETAVGAVEGEVAEEVVVVAELPALLLGRLGLRIELRAIGKDRITPADENVSVIALRDVVLFISMPAATSLKLKVGSEP
jgi:hypothetical protein